LGVSLNCVVSEVLYLRWFLCGWRISDCPVESVMVGECWWGDVMFFAWCVYVKWCHASGLYLNSYTAQKPVKCDCMGTTTIPLIIAHAVGWLRAHPTSNREGAVVLNPLIPFSIS
jgi:hypothetical protein